MNKVDSVSAAGSPHRRRASVLEEMANVSMRIVVQPPVVVRLGAILDPPLVATMSFNNMTNGHSGDLDQIWAFVTLVDEYSRIVSESLTGSLAESANALDSSTWYFLFDNLAVQRVGVYRLRVTLMRIDGSGVGAASIQQIESRLFNVEDRDVQEQLPSMGHTGHFSNSMANL
jgi:hypothetical protein